MSCICQVVTAQCDVVLHDRIAFWNDELLGDLMHPHRHDFPDDFVQYFRNKITAALGDSRHIALVSFDETDLQLLTGYADWLRQSGSKHEENGGGSVNSAGKFDHGHTATKC